MQILSKEKKKEIQEVLTVEIEKELKKLKSVVRMDDEGSFFLDSEKCTPCKYDIVRKVAKRFGFGIYEEYIEELEDDAIKEACKRSGYKYAGIVDRY